MTLHRAVHQADPRRPQCPPPLSRRSPPACPRRRRDGQGGRPRAARDLSPQRGNGPGLGDPGALAWSAGPMARDRNGPCRWFARTCPFCPFGAPAPCRRSSMGRRCTAPGAQATLKASGARHGGVGVDQGNTERERSLAAIRDVVLRHAGPDVGVLLFGSWARGEERRSSDVDVALDGHGRAIDPSRLSGLREALEDSRIAWRVDVLDLSCCSVPVRRRVVAEAIVWND